MFRSIAMIGPLTLLVSLLVSLGAYSSAAAQVVVQGNSEARACYFHAAGDLKGRKSSVKRCETALRQENLDRKDAAATHVNLGILLMRRGDHAKSLAAYDRAIDLRPNLAEAHINRGACLIFLGRPEDAISALSQSLDLGTDHAADAHFNRAIAHERLGNIKAAYNDLKKAQSLRPDWEIPTRALERYQVVSKAN